MIHLTTNSIQLLAQQFAGQGMETQVVDTWPLPQWLTLLLLIASAVYVTVIYLHERGTAGLLVKLSLAVVRLMLIALAVYMLYGWMRERFRTDLPDVVIAVDDSASMDLADKYDDATLRAALQARIDASALDDLTRFNLAKSLLLANDSVLLDELRERYNLKFHFVGASARSRAAEREPLLKTLETHRASGEESRLGKCLRDVIEGQRGRPTAAVILLTDGVTTEGRSIGEVAEYARLKSIPLYTIGLGNEKSPRDLRLSDLLVEEVVFVGDVVNFDFKLTGSGFDGESVTVRLKQTDDSRVLAEKEVTVGEDGQPQSVRITYRPPEKGDFEYVVEVEPREDEANADNNRLVRTVSVRDETIRVLLAQAYPSYEFRFLKTLLGRQLKQGTDEKSIELTTVLQEAGEGFAELDETARRGFPVSREELFRYDVIIFGDVDPSEFTGAMLENVAAFVTERGGGVVFIAGERYTPLAYRDTPLARLMPVDIGTAVVPDANDLLDDKFPVRPTRLGMNSPQMQLGDTAADSLRIWQRLEGVYWLLEAPDRKPGTRILAEHPTRTGSDGSKLPVILLSYAGAGKVIFHCSDETYRWRVRIGDVHFARYWIQTLRYLSRSKLLAQNNTAELTSDRDEYRRGDMIRLRLRFFDDRLAPPQDDGVTVVLEREGSKRRQIQLRRDATSRGIFEGAVANAAEGQYRAWVATPTLEGNPPVRRFSVVAPPGEQARLEMDSADLQRAAKTTGGQFYTVETADRLLDDLPRGRHVRIQSLPETHVWSFPFLPPLFDLWLVPVIFVVLIVSEWLLRKRVGLL